MAKTKTLTPEEIISIVLELSFKDKVSVFDAIKASLLDQSKLIKQEGEYAANVLKNIELNGKQ